MDLWMFVSRTYNTHTQRYISLYICIYIYIHVYLYIDYHSCKTMLDSVEQVNRQPQIMQRPFVMTVGFAGIPASRKWWSVWIQIFSFLQSWSWWIQLSRVVEFYRVLPVGQCLAGIILICEMPPMIYQSSTDSGVVLLHCFLDWCCSGVLHGSSRLERRSGDWYTKTSSHLEAERNSATTS